MILLFCFKLVHIFLFLFVRVASIRLKSEWEILYLKSYNWTVPMWGWHNKNKYFLNSYVRNLFPAHSIGCYSSTPKPYNKLLRNSDWFNVDCQMCSVSTQCWFAEQSLVFSRVLQIGRLKQTVCLTTKLILCMFVIFLFIFLYFFSFVTSCIVWLFCQIDNLLWNISCPK